MRRRLVASVALAALVVVGAAGAAGQWIEPEGISAPGPNVGGAQIGLDDDGNATVVWEAAGAIKTAYRPVGGAWQVLDDLASAGAGDPDLWVHSGGSAVATWSANDEIHASFRPAGGEWEVAEQLSTEGRGTDNQSVVAGDTAGNVFVLWIEEAGAAPSDNFIVRAVDRPAGGNWGSPVTLSGAGDAFNVKLAVNSDGDAVAAWLQAVDTPVEGDMVQVRYRLTGQAWGATEDLTEVVEGGPSFSGAIDAAIDSAGKAAVVWSQTDGGSTFTTYAAFYTPGDPEGAWGAPEPVSPSGEEAGTSRVAMDSDGNTTVIWRTGQVRASTLPAGESVWEDAVTISPDGHAADQQLRLGYDPGGTAFALWGGAPLGELSTFIQGATRAPGEDWAVAEEQISDANSQAPDMAFDALGNAAVAWTHGEPASRMIEWAVWDAADPQLNNVQAPSSGFARQRLTFSVEPLEIAPDGPPEWHFDDGKQASGNTVAHTFAGPGTYEVTVTQADKAGNQATELRYVTISVVKCFGSRATKVGSSGNDVIRGTGGRDVIVALGGADTIRGRGGSDKICGGGGPDHLFGQGGNDSLNGQAGNDVCHQGSGIGRHVSC